MSLMLFIKSTKKYGHARNTRKRNEASCLHCIHSGIGRMDIPILFIIYKQIYSRALGLGLGLRLGMGLV